MHDIHLSRELLRAVARGEVPPRTLIEIGLEHLRGLCPTCAEEWRAWARQRAGELAERPLPRSPETFGMVIAGLLPRLQKEEAAAGRDFRDLLAGPPEGRLPLIEKARSRFRGPALARLLLAEARRLARLDAQASGHWAELACKVASRVPDAETSAELVALALAEMANAQRLSNDRKTAALTLSGSRNIARLGGVADPLAIARIDKLEGSLCLDQRRFKEAEALLVRARLLYGLVPGAETEVVRVEITLALLFLESGVPQRAAQCARETLRGPGLECEARLFFLVRINLARALAETANFEEALTILDEDEEPHRRLGDSLMQLRYPWIRGRIAAARREYPEAEAHFVRVRDGFVAAGMGFDAALVSLDLAEVYLRAGRNRETKRLAEEMVPIFAAQDIHQEALAALRVFTEAAQREALSLALVRDLRGYLAEARHDLEVAFTPGK